jgi:hypothetical protein
MSHESSTSRSLYKLSLVTRPGIAIRLLDSSLSEIARGSGQLDTQLPEGLYLVRWNSAGHQSESMVRLDGRQEKTQLKFDPSEMESDVSSKLSSKPLTHALIDAVSEALTPSERTQDSSIVVIVTGERSLLENVADLRIRLYDRNDVAMRRDSVQSLNLDLLSNEKGYIYQVKPGRFHVGFRSILNERLGLIVPSLAGRKTVVFLKVKHTRLIVPDVNRFVAEDSVGIDPAETMIVTVLGDEETYRMRERMRLAQLLIYDLANGTNSLTQDVVSVLDNPQTDPLLRFYGALVALSTLKRGESLQTPGDGASVGSSADVLQRWGRRILDWIPNPAQPGIPADALAAHWELARAIPQAIIPDRFRILPKRIESPPMLDCAWRWAIEESIARPTAVRGTALVAAATRSSGGTAAWLCWQLSASKARLRRSSATEDLPSLLDQVVAKLETVTGTASINRMADKMKLWSSDIQETALRALNLINNTDHRPMDTVGITDLAVSLGLPARQLTSRLDRFSKMLDAAVTHSSKEEQEDCSSLRPIDTAPALKRRVIYRDDLQRGRFGGEASLAGFRVSAEFSEGRSKNWVRIRLLVEGPGEDGEEVEFHLHDSFKPASVKRRFKRGVAKLLVSAWGGFTVGIWIPRPAIELELNLAALKTAPQIIQER